MLLQFEVIVSSNIRRKKPWPKIRWIGKQKESVCLLDRKRASILYLPSGRTRRVITALKSHMKNVVFLNTSASGEYVVALLMNGQIVRLHKDTNKVITIPTCPDFTPINTKDSKKIHLYVSDDGGCILLIVDCSKINVWEQVEPVGASTDIGEWSLVDLGLGPLKSVSFKETEVHAIFFRNQIQGKCCLCTFVCNHADQLVVCNLLLHWNDEEILHPNTPNFTSSASYHTYPFNDFQPSCRAIRIRGAFVARITHNGQTVAVALNQRQPNQTQMLFLHPYTSTSVATDLKSMGSKGNNVLAQFAKTYWVVDMAWTCDDLFLACMTGRGSLFLLSKLGHPLLVATHKQGIEFGPSIFIPLLPLIEHDKKKDHTANVPARRPGSPNSLASSMISEKSWRQRFSVTAHPRLPILLCSDGYIVTALQITEIIRPRDVATLSLVETNRHLRRIVDKYKLEASALTTPRYDFPGILVDQAKFREHRLSRLYAKWFKKKKSDRKPLAEKQNVAEDSFTKENEDIKKLVYKFEEEEAEGEIVENESPESPDEAENKENVKKPSGAILNADEGKISFADLSLTLDPQTVEDSFDASAVDGKTLMESLKYCITKMCSSWGIIVSERTSESENFRTEGTKSKDDLHTFFLQSVTSLCRVLNECQHLAHCLPWSLMEGHHHDKTEVHIQEMLCDLEKTFGDKIAALTAWSYDQLPLVAATMHVIIRSILKNHRSAPEGCSSITELSDNFSVAVAMLLQTEKTLSLVHSYHEAETVGGNQFHPLSQSFRSLDVASMQGLPHGIYTRPLMLFPVWKDILKYLTDLSKSEPDIQVDPSMQHLLSFLQRLLLRSMTQGDLSRGVILPTVQSMTSLLSQYKLDAALHLASVAVNEQFANTRLWKNEKWQVVELLCSCMASYFTNGDMLFTTQEPMKRSFQMERKWATAAIRTLRISESWTAGLAVSFLLSSGRIKEASVLAMDAGDWRSATVLSAICTKVRAFTDDGCSLGVLNGSEGMKKSYTALEILQERFKSLIPSSLLEESGDDDDEAEKWFHFDPENAYRELTDLFLVAVMTGNDLASWAAKFTLGRLKTLCQGLGFFVDPDTYLPAPPLYLPQPTVDDTKGDAQSAALRQKISTLLRFTLVIFHSIGITQDASSWYIRKLEDRSRSPTSSASETLPKTATESFGSEECQSLLSAFRETCFLMWALHVREQISLYSRRYQVLRETGQDYESSAWECLHWVGRLRPFAKFMQCEPELQDLVLCLVASVKLDYDVASLLATYFHTPKVVEPKVETRYKQIMSKMRKMTVPVQRNGTLAGTDSESETQNPQNQTLQPLTVFYQRQCKAYSHQTENRFFPHIFMKQKPLDGTGTSTMSNTLMSVDENLLPSDAGFVFESDRLYHKFVAQLFDIVLDKSLALRKFSMTGKRSKRSKFPNKLLVLGNRFQIATEELNSVADVNVSRLKRFSTRIEARSPPEYFSTPKSAVKKTSSVGDLTASTARELKFSIGEYTSMGSPEKARILRRYFSQPEVNESQESEDPLEARCPLLDAEKVPIGMQKRVQRLTSYANWLEHWSERHLPSQKRGSTSAMRLSVTKDQLLTGLVVAELRFGKRDYFQMTGTGSDRTSGAGSARDIPESEDDVTTVSSIAEENQQVADSSDAAISKAVSDHLMATDGDQVPQVEADEAAEEDFDEVDKTIIKEEDTEGDKEEEKSSPGGTFVDNHGKDSTLRPEDLQDGEDSQAPESTVGASTAEPDGGGIRKPPTPTPVTQSDSSVAGVVRGEIQNVLLAQQVSLLSQILLGQTMIASQGGAATAGAGNPILNGVLQSLVPGFSLQPSQLAPVTQKPPEPKPVVEEKIQEEISQYPMQVIPKSREQKFPIPLFHIPGITNSQDPKTAKLQRTPGSRQAWAASTAVKKSRYETETSSLPPGRMRLINLQSPSKPLLVKDLSETEPKQLVTNPPVQPPPLGHNPDRYTHETQNDVTDAPTSTPQPRSQPQHRDPPQHPHSHFLKFPAIPRRELAYTSRVPGPSASGAYKTQFPMTQTHVEPPARPQFAPALPRRAWSAETVPVPFSRIRGIPQDRQAPVRRELVPRLIDPKEVLAYEGRKHGFQSVSKKPGASSRAPPVPLMKVKAPPFESGPARDRAGPSVAHREADDKENVDPDKTAAREPRTRTKAEPTKKEVQQMATETPFEGYLNQEAINREVAMMSGSDSDGVMTPADAHFVASLAKKAPHKPRMKDAQMQVIIEDKEESPNSSTLDEEPGDYRDKLTTKPLKPPPDIFLKLRLETDVVAEPDTVDRTGFLHVGDVSIESVKRGLPQKSTPAEIHYKAVNELRPDVTPYAPGFPLETTTNVESILSDHLKDVNRIREVREVTRERWTSAMQQMGAQLDAIDVMAKNMNDDFKSSEKLIRTIDTLGEVMAPTEKRRYPRHQERSLRQDPELTAVKKLSPRGGGRDTHYVRSPTKLSPSHRSYEESRDSGLEHFPLARSRDVRHGDPYDFKTSSSRYKARLQEAYQLSAPPGGERSVPEYSDVDDHVSSSSSASMLYSAKHDRPYETPREFPTIAEVDDDVSMTSSSMEKMDARRASIQRQEKLVRDLIEDNESSNLKVKSFDQRSDIERQKVRRWMEQKRRERTGEYQERVKALREAEAKPFKGAGGHVTQKQIEESQRRREERRRQMLHTHHNQRVNESVHLMEEIRSEKPRLPEHKSSHSAGERAFAKSSKTRRSPLKEVNGHLNTTYRINKRSTPYRKKPANQAYREQKGHGSYSSPDTVDPMSDVSMSSVLSTWKLSDDVRRLLYGSVEKRNKGHVTFDLDDQSSRSSASHVSGMPPDDLEMKSCGTASLLGDVDWNDVDAMVAAVDRA